VLQQLYFKPNIFAADFAVGQMQRAESFMDILLCNCVVMFELGCPKCLSYRDEYLQLKKNITTVALTYCWKSYGEYFIILRTIFEWSCNIVPIDNHSSSSNQISI